MRLSLNSHACLHAGRYVVAAILATMLSACGGGGGSPGVVSGGNGGAGSEASTGLPTLNLTMTDGSGAAATTLSGGQSGVIRAAVTDSEGKPASNAIVTFAASDASLIEFSPVSASALTDSDGMAVVNIKPKDFTSSGALSITAQAVVGAKTATKTINIAVGAAPLTVGTLSFAPPLVGPLPAFNTVTLNIPVTSNGQPVNSVSGLVLTSLCVGDGTAELTLGTLSNGVQLATYTNKGCVRGTDTITASIGTSSKSISLSVDSANIGTIRFVGSDLTGTSLVRKGSGGLGRTESAQLTFKVVDQNNNGLAGVDVSFTATTTTGGLTVLPANGTTDSTGTVTTTVSSGTVPTPVRINAQATRNGKTISGLSDALTISTGLPIQKSMSLSADKWNIEGWEYDNETAKITILMADQYGNPISDGTTINFVSEGGAVGSSAQGACNTVGGGCTVSIRSQDFRPLNGRVTVLAYAQGVENFVDSDGNGQYSCTNFRDTNGNIPNTYRPLVDVCVSGGESFTDMGDPFLDAGYLDPTTGVSLNGTLDGVYTAANGDLPFPYNSEAYQPSGNGKWGINYIRRSGEIIFSGSTAKLIRQVCDSAGTCRDWVSGDGDPSVIQGLAGAGCKSQPLVFRVTDVNNNPMPAGTTVAGADAVKVTPQTVYPDNVASTNSVGGTLHQLAIKPSDTCDSGSFTIKVTTPKGKGTGFTFSSN